MTSQQRQRFEPKLGADLSDVRVHTGGASAQAAAGLSARAFTVGNDIHFNSGEFAPGAKEGDHLLAHELTHVVQGKKTGVQRKQKSMTLLATRHTAPPVKWTSRIRMSRPRKRPILLPMA